MTSAGRWLAVLFAGYAEMFAVLLRVPQRWWTPIVLTSVSLVIFVVLLLLLRRTRQSSGPIVLGGAALQAVAITGRPTTSDDVYRYVWDGKVQLHGIDPYRYVPSAPQLAHLRDGMLFGPHSPCFHQIPDSCTAINRPQVHTIYPPFGQLVFDLVRLVSFGSAGVLAFQIAAALGTTAVSLVLARVARLRGWAPWRIAVWVWCPLVVIEFGNNAHLDWAAVLLCVLALVTGVRARPVRSGALLGAAIMTKLYPALLLPALLRSSRARVLGGVIAVAVVGYAPHVLAVGAGVVGYLPGYLHEQGYDSGSRFQLLGAVLPHPVDTVTGVAALVAVAIWLLRRASAVAIENAAVLMVGVAFLVTTPRYSWYAGLLVALVVLSARWEWLPVAFAAMLAYVTRATTVPGAAVYLAGLVAAIAVRAIIDARKPPATDTPLPTTHALRRKLIRRS